MVKINSSLEHYRTLYVKEFITNHKKYYVGDTLLSMLTRNLGFSDSYDKLIFTKGVNEFLVSVSLYCDNMMLNLLKKETIPLSTTKKISLATSIRLRVLDKNLLAKILQYYLYPSKQFDGIKLAFKTCNSIWRYAGDKSTDYNFYTKRILLLSVLLPSLLYYLGDNSIDHTDTDYFIDSSLEKIVKIASIKKQIKIPKLEDIPFIRMLI